VSLLGYCLMSNHVHLIVVPCEASSLASAMKLCHGRYATYWNSKHASSGHVWQGRFYSCPLDETHLWQALRYTELNPARAGMAVDPCDWPWSSAASHCRSPVVEGLLAMEMWRARWNPERWTEYLMAPVCSEELKRIRRNTHTGRPLGTEDFVQQLEVELGRALAPQKGGRPKRVCDLGQNPLPF
jgi:putative transposase